MGKRSNASAGTTGRTAITPAVRASSAATAKHCARFAAEFVHGFYRRTRTDLSVSSIALGTYLGECDEETDAAYGTALLHAIASGVNVVDTAINYRCQRAERSVGSALATMFASGSLRREEIVVCTKAGYIPLDGNPPATRDEYQRYVEREYFSTGVLRPQDIVGGAHSLAPAFLSDQLRRSLENLRLQAVDYFYLHNPEQQLAAISPEELYGRIRLAFETLESWVDAGSIGAYGCATWNGLRVPAESHGHLSLYRLEAIAREVAGERHHFRVVQLPVNLSMSEAVRVSTQRDSRGRLVHVVDAAQQLGIDLVVSAPLLQGQLARQLPDSVRQLFTGETDAQRALAFTLALPGVVTVAVGTRQVGHLEENLSASRTGSPSPG